MPKSDKLPLPFPLPGRTAQAESVTVVRTGRKTIAVELNRDGSLLVRAPLRYENAEIRLFLLEKQRWIVTHVEKLNAALEAPSPVAGDRLTEEEVRALAEKAKNDLPLRAARFAPIVGVSYGKISLKAQKTRWGSCSSAGNLHFNILLMLAPPEARDYVVVHELCHRLEMNHSPRFWAQVARVCPGYREQVRWFRENGSVLMKRLFG